MQFMDGDEGVCLVVCSSDVAMKLGVEGNWNEVKCTDE